MIDFQEVKFTQPILNQETGNVTYGYDNDETIAIYKNNNSTEYYFPKYQRYFIKMDNAYVLNLWLEKHENDGTIEYWNSFQESEKYYIPVIKEPSVYQKNLEQIEVNFCYSTNDNSQETWSSSLTIPQNNTEGIPKIKITPGNKLNMNFILVLKIILDSFGDYPLVDLEPIALKYGETKDNGIIIGQINSVSGSHIVRYSSNGEIDYDKNPFKIYTSGNLNSLNGQWRLLTFKDDVENGHIAVYYTDAIASGIDDNFLPSLTNDNILQPSNVFIPQYHPYALQYVVVNNNVETIYWTQPIVVYEDNYPSTNLNQWNGKEITTDNDTNTIIASGFAAGRKERDNTFSGVVLGDWSKTDSDMAMTKNTGIYGFNHGAMSYAFKDDGTGFIGKDGKGRIYLDGDKSQIFSSMWTNQDNPQGMLLDVDDGYIKMQQTIASTTYSPVSSYTAKEKYRYDATASYYIMDNANVNLYYWSSDTAVQVNQNAYYGYVNSVTNPATATNAQKVNQYYIAPVDTKYITLGANQPNYPLSIGLDKNVGLRKFKVKWDGTTYITDGEFSGRIRADNGNIGGWTITEDYLYSGSTTLSSYDGISTDSIYINGLGTIGAVVGSSGTILGINATDNKGIAIESPTGGNGGIRLSGPGDGVECNGIFLQTKNLLIGSIGRTNDHDNYALQITNDAYNPINQKHDNQKYIIFNVPASHQYGIYARFA